MNKGKYSLKLLFSIILCEFFRNLSRPSGAPPRTRFLGSLKKLQWALSTGLFLSIIGAAREGEPGNVPYPTLEKCIGKITYLSINAENVLEFPPEIKIINFLAAPMLYVRPKPLYVNVIFNHSKTALFAMLWKLHLVLLILWKQAEINQGVVLIHGKLAFKCNMGGD